MCRHAAYVGPGIAVSEIMRDMDHSLEHQSFSPRELLVGTVCADGFGVAWYDRDSRPEPARYASILPIWNDTNLPSFGPLVRSSVVMGAVRNATVPGGLAVENCAPFVTGRLSLSLNGFLDDFDESWKDAVVSMMPAGTKVKGTTDAEHLLYAVAARQEAGLATAVQSVLRELLELGGRNGLEAQLNLLVSDGEQVVASRAGNLERQNSLYHLQDGDEFPGGHVVASEPLYDDPLWTPVDPSTVVALRSDAPPVRLRV